MSESSLLTLSLGSFFGELLEEALEAHALCVAGETLYYLISLLERFALAEHLHHSKEPLVLLLSHANEVPREQADAIYQKVGDTSLYLSGFFSSSLRRRSLSPDYYAFLGKHAYAELSRRQRRPQSVVMQEVYEELSESFELLVEVLIDIGARHRFNPSSAVEDLASRWVNRRSEGAAKALVERGLIPLVGGDPEEV